MDIARIADQLADALGFVNQHDKPVDNTSAPYSVAHLATEYNCGASVIRQALGMLYGDGRAVPVVHNREVRWRRPTKEERLGL